MEGLKKLFVFLLLAIFMISFASASDWDNTYDYNKETKTATIENWLGLGSDLAYVTLTSPHNVKVTRGEDRLVGTFNFTTTGDFTDAFGDIFLTDMKNGNSISRGKQFKYKKYTEVSVDDYEKVCEDITTVNGTIQNCTHVEIGSHMEIQMDWIPINNPNNIFYEGVTYEIGVFVDVEAGDWGDWRPQIMGVEIVEWAIWTESLNVDIVSYWKLDEQDVTGTGTILDSLTTNDGTNVGGTNTSGIINTAYSFDGSSDYINISASDIAFPLTLNLWFKSTSIETDYAGILTKGGVFESDTNFDMGFRDDDTPFLFWRNSGTLYGSENAGATNYFDNNWHMMTGVIQSNGDMEVFIDNVSVVTDDSNSPPSATTHPIRIARQSGTTGSEELFDGDVDEVSIWNRTLNSSEISQLYNNGLGISYIENDILVTLNSPPNNTIQNDATVDFNWTITPVGLNITNWTLDVWFNNGTLAHQHINTTINTDQTTIVIHNDTLFLDESYVWRVESCGVNGGETICDLSANWTFTLDTAPPVVNITYPPEGFIVTTPGQNITLNYTVVHPVGNLSNCFYNTSSNSTEINISCTANTTSLLYPSSNPINLTIFVYANDTAANLGSDNVTIFKDTTGPQINITSPIGIFNFTSAGNNETLNWSVSDGDLDTCLYNYNGTNVTVNCSLNTTNFIIEYKNYNLTFYANDTFGNTNNSFISWDYTIFEINQSFEENITEGELDDFSLLLNISDTSSLTDATFSYNGTNYTTTIVFSSGLYLISSLIVSPTVDADTNFSFNFFFTVDGMNYSSVSNEQLVVNSLFDICGGISNDTLLNMSLVDEETSVSISGTIEIIAEIVSQSSGVTVGTINNTFENKKYGAICFTPAILYPSYYLNAEIKYSSDGYVTELYYIQNSDMTDYPRNLTLFDLNQTDSTEFVVTFQNDAFVLVEGAIIQLQRKYIGENVYKTVEAPITADGGKAIVHIDLNTNIYRASIVKDGELLKFFEEIVFSCDNELAGECEEQLRGNVDPNNDVAIENLLDFSYSVSVSNDNNTVTTLFSVPSGTPSSINVLLEQIDMFGNSTSCNTTVITSAGSITCDFSDTIEKSILQLTISKDGTQLAITNYGVDPELDMDGMNFFIVFLFLISLVGMAIASPEWMMIIGIMVFMISGTLLLLKGMSLAMGLGAMAWLVVAVIIIILKMAKQEDR